MIIKESNKNNKMVVGIGFEPMMLYAVDFKSTALARLD